LSTISLATIAFVGILTLSKATSLHEALGLLFSVEYHELLTVLLIRHAKLLSDLNQASKTINVVGMLVVDLLIDL
jgi:hypothetical protein